MAHNINYNEQTGKYSFYSVKEKAWHNLGQIAEQYETSGQVLDKAGLNFIVEKRPLFTYDTENFAASQKEDTEGAILIPEIKVPNLYANVRTDTEVVLGVTGSDYRIVQNKEAFEFFDAIAGKDGVFYETAGALGNGERIFITSKLPDYIRIGNDDIIEKYLFLTTSHDGKSGIIAAFTPIRIVCNNTLNAALANCSNMVVIRHTTGVNERLKAAHKIMGMISKASPVLQEVFSQMAAVKISDPDVKKLIQLALAPNKEVLDNIRIGKEDENSTAFKNMVENAFGYAMLSETQTLATTRGTVFGAYNGVTGYFQNARKYKDNDAKLKSILYGGTAQLKSQKAFDLCLDYLKKGSEALSVN